MYTTRKACLITGCSEGGVGAGLAEIFRKNGYHVFATARSPSKIPQALHADDNVTVLALDVTSSESIKEAAETVGRQSREKLDVLINNAGAGSNMPALDISITEAKKVFDANFFGVLEVVQAFAPMLVNAKGCIVNNSSMGGVMNPNPFTSMYGASKAALTNAGECWRLELAPLGVRVITLITGGVTTKFLENIQPITLPDASYYHSVKDIIEKQPEEVPFGVSPEAFGKDVLHYVERDTTGTVWIGGASCIARIVYALFPQAALDRLAISQKPFTATLAEERKKAS